MVQKEELKRSFEPLICFIRDRRVMLDSDLARWYGVTTRRFNEAFRRNQKRFPEDFAFQLDQGEYASLRSQTATSNRQVVDNNKNPSMPDDVHYGAVLGLLPSMEP